MSDLVVSLIVAFFIPGLLIVAVAVREFIVEFYHDHHHHHHHPA